MQGWGKRNCSDSWQSVKRGHILVSSKGDSRWLSSLDQTCCFLLPAMPAWGENFVERRCAAVTYTWNIKLCLEIAPPFALAVGIPLCDAVLVQRVKPLRINTIWWTMKQILSGGKRDDLRQSKIDLPGTSTSSRIGSRLKEIGKTTISGCLKQLPTRCKL